GTGERTSSSSRRPPDGLQCGGWLRTFAARTRPRREQPRMCSGAVGPTVPPPTEPDLDPRDPAARPDVLRRAQRPFTPADDAESGLPLQLRPLPLGPRRPGTGARARPRYR